MTLYGIKVSKEGYDVKTATDDQLIYSSQFGNLKIYSILTASVQITGADTNGSTTIDNPLPYPPLFFGYVESHTVSPGIWRPSTVMGTSIWPIDDNFSYVTANYRPNTNDFLLTIAHIGSGTRVFNFRLVLFVDVIQGDTASIGETSSHGIIVSKTGIDAATGNQSDMSIHSDYASLTISSISSVSATGVSTEYHTASFTHGLGYVPIFMTFITDETNVYYRQPMTLMVHVGQPTEQNLHSECWADNDKIYVQGYYTTHKIITFDQALI